ncbi:sugar phosphate isomerase/epimerase [Flavobacterium sp. 25HG05S-40]|uniref:sugar phosphate isomerase/epimerase n=1 Tax=Flavobacterium sp. 25HG05S-40 TaxID=3458682 RepID=UPI004043EBD5
MTTHYTCTYWGCENQSAKSFLDAVIAQGYDGVEINFPDNQLFITEFMNELDNIRKTINPNFIFIAQQVLSNKTETVVEYTQRMGDRLRFLMDLKPNYINSHTGKDYYDFSDNCSIIEHAEQLSKSSSIPIWHEIHRGRFSFHAKTLLNYLELFPNLKLVADFSHFAVVSESNLEDQAAILGRIYPHIRHLHARVGFSQSPQVNDPFAPEWQDQLEHYLTWWNEIVAVLEKRKIAELTITPEFGPFPYMPQEPFTQKPLANQWETNVKMKNYLQHHLTIHG